MANWDKKITKKVAKKLSDAEKVVVWHKPSFKAEHAEPTGKRLMPRFSRFR